MLQRQITCALVLSSTLVFSGCGTTLQSPRVNSDRQTQEQSPDQPLTDVSTNSVATTTVTTTSTTPTATATNPIILESPVTIKITENANPAEPSKPVPVKTPEVMTKAVTFNINGGSFFFEPNSMQVKKGDTVTINFKNVGGMHNLAIDAFSVSTPVVKSGESATVTFVADKAGTFEYYCAVGSHRAMGQKGTLTVTE